MRSIIIDVGEKGAQITLVLRPGETSGQAVLLLGDSVEIASSPSKPAIPISSPSGFRVGFQEYERRNGFPPRALTEQAIIQILRENGGSVRIRDSETGWNIYDEVAARLGVSVEARRRRTAGTGEPAWRPEVGYARKHLEQQGIILPTEVSGRGVWSLSPAALRGDEPSKAEDAPDGE